MSDVHAGGCLCGAVRYRVRGQPARTSATTQWCFRITRHEVFEKGTLPPKK